MFFLRTALCPLSFEGTDIDVHAFDWKERFPVQRRKGDDERERVKNSENTRMCVKGLSSPRVSILSIVFVRDRFE